MEERGEVSKDLYTRVLDDIVHKRERVLSGKVNCIPWGLPRFENYNPGIEQGKYYLITANSKVGKTKITNHLFMFNAIKQVLDDNLNVNLRIFYFALEMSKEEMMLSAFSNILYIKSGVRVSPTDLKSTKSDRVLSEDVIELIKENKHYLNKLEEIVTFIDSIRHPTGIFKFMQDYALRNGTQHRKTVTFTNNRTGETYEKEIDDFYEPDDPEEYVMCIIDHISLITPESENGRQLSLHESITRLSSNYLVQLRRKYNHIPVVVQQQSAAQESLENAKYDKLKPSLDGLGDNKLTQRDANTIIGLFSPYRHKIKDYLGYDIEFFRDNIRFLEIIGGREGSAGAISPLYFDGAVDYFKELPVPSNRTEMLNVKKFINNVRKRAEKKGS